MARDVKIAIVGDSASLRRAAESANTSLGGISSHAVALGAAVGTLAGNMATSLARMAGSALKSGLTTAASMEQASISFTTLLGSAQQSQVFLGKLSKFAAATPFELPGLVDASRQLLGAGAAAKDVIPTLTAFGDASGALGLTQDQFNHIMLATTQAMSAGTLHAGDLLQMTEAGLPVWKLMSEALGKPVSTLKAMSEKGQLLSKDVLPKLQAQMEKDYGGAMGKQSQTLSGLWSTLMDTFNQGMAKALIPMEPMLRSLIPGAAKVMGSALSGLGSGAAQFFGGLSGNVKVMDQSARPKLELFGLGIRAMGQAFQDGGVTSKGFVGVMERIGVFARQAANALSGAFRQGLDWFRKNGPVIFAGLSKAVQNLAATAIPVLIQEWNAFKQPVQALVQFVINTVIPAFASLTQWMSKHATLVGTVATIIGTLIVSYKIWMMITKTMTAVQAALNAVLAANPIGLVIIAIVALVAAFIYAYKNSETFRNIVNGAFTAVKNVIMGVYNWVKSNWPLLLAVLTGPFALAVIVIMKNWGSIKSGATAVKDWIVSVFNSVVGFFKGLPGRIASAASGLWNGITDSFKAAINTVIRIWNSLQFPSIDIPKVHIPGTNKDIGGGSITVGVPDIPLLAKGGIVTSPTLGLFGEAGPEAVVPLSRAGEFGLGGGGSQQPFVIQLVADGQILQQILVKHKRRNGGLELGIA